MAITTYLFGAGASAKAVPVMEQMKNKLKKVIRELKRAREKLTYDRIRRFPNINVNYIEIINSLINGLGELGEDLGKDQHIDLILAQLYITTGGVHTNSTISDCNQRLKLLQDPLERYLRYKINYSIFLIICEAMDGPDTRYLEFLSNCYDYSNAEWNENIRILTWNYDNQFVIAYQEIAKIQAKTKTLVECEQELGIKTKNTHFFQDEGFGIWQLNGSTKLYQIRDGVPSPEYIIEHYGMQRNLPQLTSVLLKQMLEKKFEYHYFQNYYSALSFAFETYNQPEAAPNILNSAIMATKDTDRLVVIGYSFPKHNEKADMEIINNMKNLNTIQIIDKNPTYVQTVIKLRTRGKDIEIIGTDDINFYKY